MLLILFLGIFFRGSFQPSSEIYYLMVLLFPSESSSRIYSPYVFAIGQLIGEIPYSILSAVLYWVLMVRIWDNFDRSRVSMRIALKVYPMGFGQGSAGLSGTGFQLLVILFMLLFGVTLGQMVAALSPSVQVGPLIDSSDTIRLCISRWLFYSTLSLVLFSQHSAA